MPEPDLSTLGPTTEHGRGPTRAVMSAAMPGIKGLGLWKTHRPMLQDAGWSMILVDDRMAGMIEVGAAPRALGSRDDASMDVLGAFLGATPGEVDVQACAAAARRRKPLLTKKEAVRAVCLPVPERRLTEAMGLALGSSHIGVPASEADEYALHRDWFDAWGAVPLAMGMSPMIQFHVERPPGPDAAAEVGRSLLAYDPCIASYEGSTGGIVMALSALWDFSWR